MSSRQPSDLLRNFLFVFGSQIFVLAFGLIKALIIPLVIGIEDFGCWQLYVFYTVYLGIFTLGYNDGIYLKYGGYRLEDLPLDPLRTSNLIHVILLSLGAIAVVFAATYLADPSRKFVFFAVAANIIVLGIIGNISLSLQAVNKLKGYAFLNAADKIFLPIVLAAMLAPGLRTFWYLIAIDLAGKFAVLTALLFRYRQLYFGPLARMAAAFAEFAENFRPGIQLMVANLSGMLVLGIGRIIIEYFGSLESYSYYAFAISLSNLVLLSVAAMSVVVYPTLKRQERASFRGHFESANLVYLIFALVLLTSYYAALAFILLVARSYEPVIEFLNVVFVITVFQGKMLFVNNTFYQALRLEGAMLRANIASLVVATGLSAIGYMLTQSVTAVAYATLLTMLLRVYASEIFLRRHMAGGRNNRPLLEVGVLAGFLVVTTFSPPIAGCLVWSAVVILVAFNNRKQISEIVEKIMSRSR